MGNGKDKVVADFSTLTKNSTRLEINLLRISDQLPRHGFSNAPKINIILIQKLISTAAFSSEYFNRCDRVQGIKIQQKNQKLPMNF